VSKKSRALERKMKRKSWKMTCQESQENGTLQAGLSTNKKCIFCGATHGLQRHHIAQLRFDGPDTDDNKVWICSSCHKILHWLMDQNLNWIQCHRKIDKHEIRPVPLISDEKNAVVPPIPPNIPPPPSDKSTTQSVTITGGQVTITFN